MTKTNTKTEMTVVEDCPKVRMREIRTIVSNALKQNQRIDLMDFNKRDTARVIVALQDEVMHSRERHKKATDHISDRVAMDSIVMPMMTESLMDSVEITSDLVQRNQELEELLKSERVSHMETAMELQASHGQIMDLAGRLDTMKAAIREFT